MTLEELGFEVKGDLAAIRGFKELLDGINTEKTLDDSAKDRLSIMLLNVYSKIAKEIFPNKTFALWSEPHGATVTILDTPEEVEAIVNRANSLFGEYPIPDTDDPKLDVFKRTNRFAREISFEQFMELAGEDFENPYRYSVSETGLEFTFDDHIPVIEARAACRI